jgi:COMPASS component SWD3
LHGHDSAISSVKFSPDGNFLASSSNDKTIKLWDIHEGRYSSTLIGHDLGISDITWSLDSQLIASGSDDHTVKLYDTHNEQPIHTFEGHTNFVMCVDFDPSSNFLVSGSFDRTIRVWDIRARRCFKRIQAHSDTIVSVHFNDNGTRLLTAGFDGYIRIWDVQNGNCLQSFLIGEQVVPVCFAKWSPNGRYILVGSFDESWRLLNCNTGKIVKTYVGHTFGEYCIFGCFFLNIGKWIVSGSADKCIYIWDLNSKELIQKLEGHKDVVVGVTGHPTEGLIASGALEGDKTVKLWKTTGNNS